MRKFVVFFGLLVTGIVVARRIRSRIAGRERQAVPAPSMPARSQTLHPPGPPIERPPVTELVLASGATAETAPPPPTTNGERVVLMSTWSLQERGEAATKDAVVGHVAAGEVDPDEGTVDTLLHRLVGAGLLSGGEGGEPYRLTESGQAALRDGSRARPSPAGDAAEELSSPTTS
jgi:hypothetical protein